MARILCVEDNDHNLYLVSLLLERAGFEVLVAHDGEEGVAVARAQRPDLVVMDVTLPGIDGYEATRRLKAAPETRAIPILALSAHDEVKLAGLASAAGCAAYASKPIRVQDFLGKVAALLANGAPEECER